MRSKRQSHCGWATIFLTLLCLGAASSFTKASASNQPPSVSTIDADGDDERTELLYHWQNKRFSDEERRQIAACSLLIGCIMAGGAAKKAINRTRNTK